MVYSRPITGKSLLFEHVALSGYSPLWVHMGPNFPKHYTPPNTSKL
jgi:hypothetical protein